MRRFLVIYLLCFVQLFVYAQDDGMNIRTILTYEKDIEVARISITFVPGFETTSHNDFLAYIDPDLPLNGGVPVTDGEFNLNYIRVFEPIRNNYTENIPVHNEIDYEQDWKESITYFDGLGREIQQTLVKASAYGNDVIVPIVYDGLGRKKIEYLGYAIAQDGESGPGGFRPTPIDEIESFYSSFYGDDDGDFPYSDKNFDGSPLNRVVDQSNPGLDWSLEHDHALHYTYATNAENYEAYLLNVSETNQLVKKGCYTANTLYKNSVVDEDGNRTIEYTDKQGRTIIKEVQNGSQPLITQYVYDDFGLLRYVLPPETFSRMPSGTTPQTFELNTDWVMQLCYYYQYDERKRMIIKKLPGADPVYLVYNNRDQLVLTQDGEMRQNNDWLFTKYDVFNRPVMTGKHHHDMVMTQEQMQDEVNLPNYLLFEHYVGGEGYSNDAFPEITEHDEVLTLTYYDNYNALELEEEEPSPYTFLPTDLPFYFLENGTCSGKTKGLTTITKTKVLLHDGLQVADDWLLSVTYYDKYQHPIQTITDNHLGGVTVFSSQINFTGQVEETKEQVIVPGETNVIRQQTTYDHAGRLKETKHKINDQDWVTLSRHKYNETGQLTLKKLHGGGNNFLEQITYKYNIRGWLTGINDMEHPGENRFVMQLDYNQAETPRYNGNIGSMSWQSAHFATPKQYHFSYDNANRLLTATYADAGKYTTHYTYDKNGNIENLTRMGELGGSNTYGYIDQLTYAYTGNQLKYVNDNTGDNHQNNGFTDNGSLLTTNEYFYDLNGNLTCDLNKQINHIEYNYLNLPRRIDLSGANLNTINYLYSANGVKLQKNTSIAYGRSAPTDYLGTIVYPGDAPAYIFTTEGRALRNDQGNFDYEYFLKDHLGNTRVSVNQKGTILQDNSYYPFGMSLGEALTYVDNTATENKYLYNGKEIQDDFGLGWYDYGARIFDPTLGRFMAQDKYAEVYYPLSLYSYCAGNPIKSVDVNGEFIGTIIGTVVGAAAGAYDSYQKGGDVWAGAAEGAVSGAIAGAAVDLVVTATVVTGGGALVVIGAGAAAGAVGGAAGAVVGDATGQVVESLHKGKSLSDAVSNVSGDNMLEKAKSGALNGAIGGAIGGGLAKGLDAVTKSATAIEGVMSKNIEEVASTIRTIGEQTGAPQAVVNKNVATAVNSITEGMANAGKSAVDMTNKVSAAAGTVTESVLKVVVDPRTKDPSKGGFW